MSGQAQALEHASVRQYCKAVKVPVIGANFVPLAEQAVKENRSHIGYLEALLAMESEERDRHAIAHRLHDAKLPRMKTLEEFEFARAPQIPAAKVRELAEGGYITRAEPVVLIGECGTGKTHLATGLCVAACRQKRRVRFTTAANLVNELVEASQHHGVRRVLARWMRYDVIALDEVGYVPLAEIGAEFLFQVIAERAERATLIVTTNLPFSEWTQVFPNPRLCRGRKKKWPGDLSLRAKMQGLMIYPLSNPSNSENISVTFLRDSSVVISSMAKYICVVSILLCPSHTIACSRPYFLATILPNVRRMECKSIFLSGEIPARSARS